MILGAPKAAVASREALLYTGGFLSDESQRPVWIYRDHHNKLQGPFSAASMLQWHSTGRLPQDLLVCGVAQPTTIQALESVPISCFQPLNQLLAQVAQGTQYRPIAIARQPAAMQMMQGMPQQAQAVRPGVLGNAQGMQLQQANMLAAQPGQGPMGMPAIRPAAPQLQQAFRPQGVQQVVQLQNPMGVQHILQQQQQQGNMVMMQQQQPQQMMLGSQQQGAPAMQPVMMLPQQQQQQGQAGSVMLQGQSVAPRPQLQQQLMMQQVPAVRPGGVILQQVPQQPTLPLQQQSVVRPPGVAGVSMPGSAVAARPGQPLLLQPQAQQQQGLLQQATTGKVPTIMGMQPQVQLAGTTPVPVPAGNMAASHVAQRLEHLAAQAQAHQAVATSGPVPPLALDKALPAAGPASGSVLQGTLSIGPQGPSSARSTSTSLALSGYSNLDALVQQATAAAAAAAAAGSGPHSAGAPVLLPSIRTDARSSAGVGASHTASPSTVRGHMTPSAAGLHPAATPAGSVAASVQDDDMVIDDMLFDLVEDVAVDAGEGPRAERPAATQQQQQPAGPPGPTAQPGFMGPQSGVSVTAMSPLHQQQQQPQGMLPVQARGMQPVAQLQQQQQPGVSPLARQVFGGAAGMQAVPMGGGMMGMSVQGLNAAPQQPQLVLLQANQQQQLAQQQQQQQALLQQQQQQKLLRQQQLAQQQQQQQQQTQLQQQLLQQQQAQQQQAQLRQQAQMQQHVVFAQQQQQQPQMQQQQQAQQGSVILTVEQAQQRQQQLLQAAMRQLQAGQDASATLAALSQITQQLEQIQPQQQQQQQPQQQAPQAASGPASQGPNASPAAGLGGLLLGSQAPQEPAAAAAAPNSQQQPAASSTAPAAATPGEFNPWGLSFMDTALMTEAAKGEPQHNQAQQGQVAAAEANSTQQQQQQGQAGAAQAALSEDDLLAALMPELNSTGLSADQKLALLKEMLGMQQQQQDAPAAQSQQQQQQQPQATAQQPAQQQPAQQQQGGQSTALQQLFQQATQQQQADKQQQQAPQKPQHVWLQQLANNSNKPGGAAAAAGSQANSKPGGKDGGGSEAGDEFDPSMLPSDLFDFLDASSSPTRKAAQERADMAREEGNGGWPDSQQHQEEELRDSHDPSRPAKYVPPSKRSSGEPWPAAGSGPRNSSGSASSGVPLPPPPPPAWTSREQREAAARADGSYVPPHARQRGASPPRGERTGSGSTYPPYADREREQRIQAQQQLLPPHLHIVPSEGGHGSDEGQLSHRGERYGPGEGHWPPPPPPPPSHGRDEGRDGAGEEEGKGNKLRRLFEAATAGPPGTRQPPPPPPGPPRFSGTQHWDISTQSPQRVAPEYDAEYPDGPPGARRRELGDRHAAEVYGRAGPGRAAAAAEDGEYSRPPGWPPGRQADWNHGGSAGYGDEWDGEGQRRGRGPPAERWHGEEEGRGGDRALRGHNAERAPPPYAAPGHGGQHEERGRWYEEYEEHGHDYNYPPRHPGTSPRAPGHPAPPPRPGRDQWEEAEGRSGHRPPGYPLRQPAPPPPRDGRPGGGSWPERGGYGRGRDEGGGGGGGEPRSLTWQQQELLHEYEDGEGPAGGPEGPRRAQPAWQGPGDYADMPERERHRSPDPNTRRTNMYGSPPSGQAPQPSQHLRAAAHFPAGRAPPPPKQGRPDDLQQSRYQEDFPVLGAAAARGAAAAADRSDSLYRSESASAAALAAVAGLRPSITVPPPRSAKPGRRGGVGLTTQDGSFHTGPQLPSVEETKAAVMAALGSGPRPSAAPLPHSGSSSSLTGAQDEGAEGPAQLRKGSRGTLEGPAAPRRNVVAATGLFSNVIGQLRRQSTARESADTQDGGDEAYGSPDGDDAPSSRGSYLSAARPRRVPSDNAGDIVLAVINSTRQRASKLSGRPRQAGAECDVGKADAAWLEGAPDTANSCDSSCGSTPQEAA